MTHEISADESRLVRFADRFIAGTGDATPGDKKTMIELVCECA